MDTRYVAEFSHSLSLSLSFSCSSLLRNVFRCRGTVRVLLVCVVGSLILHQISQNRPFTGPIRKQMERVQVLCEGL